MAQIRDLHERLYAMRVFRTSDAAREAGTTSEVAAKRLSYLQSQGYVEKIRRGLWAIVPLGERGLGAHPNPYLVGARLAGDQPYALVYHTALELHGVAHSPSDLVHVGVTKESFAPFSHEGVEYRPRAIGTWEADWTTGIRVEGQEVRVTDREATFVHCVQNPRWSGGVEEVLRSVSVWPSLDGRRVLDFTRRLGKRTAFHRVGYVLERFREQWGIDSSVLEALRAEVKGKSPDYWGTRPGQENTFDNRYQIVVPATLEDLRGA